MVGWWVTGAMEKERLVRMVTDVEQRGVEGEGVRGEHSEVQMWQLLVRSRGQRGALQDSRADKAMDQSIQARVTRPRCHCVCPS